LYFWLLYKLSQLGKHFSDFSGIKINLHLF
jgi:hypothetical protein